MAPNKSYIYLHKVEGANGINSNKYYEMKADASGSTWTATYGREGAAKPATETYPMSKWEDKYKEKIGPRKGYTDVTAFKSVAKPVASVKDSKGQIISTDAEVVRLVNLLQSYANVATAASYKVEAKSVTQAQIDAAQKQIDNIANAVKKYYGSPTWNIDNFNKALTQLMIIIPRKMKKVADHLMKPGVDKKTLTALIDAEQDLLDSMASQVTAQTATDDSTDTKNDVQTTLLEALGLTMRIANDKEFNDAKRLATNHKNRINKVYVVTNKATQTLFDANMKAADDKKTLTLWHGSRRQNWWFILQQGLKIRPSGAVHTGSMFDDGVYFASDDDKSMGYTDGGRWVNGGNSGKTYMALYEVRVGKQLVKHQHDSSCYTISKTVKSNGYDSVHAKAGPSLRKDEFIIYNHNQSTIKYLVEFN
ncbi:MAG: hypothetical protein ABIP51_11780 [Bacteroidia bacterium]